MKQSATLLLILIIIVFIASCTTSTYTNPDADTLLELTNKIPQLSYTLPGDGSKSISSRGLHINPVPDPFDVADDVYLQDMDYYESIMAFTIPEFKRFIENNADSIRPDTPISINEIVYADETANVDLNKFKYHLAGRNLQIYWIFKVIFTVDGETLDDFYRMRINIKEDPTNEGYYLADLAWFNTSNGFFNVKYFEYDNKIISSEDWWDGGDHFRNYREYYLYNEANAYCDLYHYQTKTLDDTPVETLIYILHSTGDDPAGVYIYEEEEVADEKQYIYYDSTFDLVSTNSDGSGFPASFTNLISPWLTNAPSEITNYDPDDYLPAADSSHFVDLGF